MKTYEAIFEPGKNKGVFGISLVENPAMEGTFIALSKDDNKIQLKTIDEEQKILIGLVLEPNKPIYRNQDGEEFNIVFSEDTIKELSHGFYKGGFQKNSSLEHSDKIEGVTFVESWTIEDPKNDKSNAFGLSYPKGSWIAMMKVDSDEVWNDYVKTGKVTGFSVDAMVSLKEINLKTTIKMSDSKSITDAIAKGFTDFIAVFGKTKTDEEKEAERLAALKLASIKSANGDVDIQFEGEEMAVGGKVWILAEDKTEVPLPVGNYELEDGRILVVSEEGLIAEVKEKPATSQAPAEMTAEQTAANATAIENTIKSIMIKYNDIVVGQFDAKLAEMQKTYDAKILALSEAPATKPIVSAPAQVSLKTTPKERMFEFLQTTQNT